MKKSVNHIFLTLYIN